MISMHHQLRHKSSLNFNSSRAHRSILVEFHLNSLNNSNGSRSNHSKHSLTLRPRLSHGECSSSLLSLKIPLGSLSKLLLRHQYSSNPPQHFSKICHLQLKSLLFNKHKLVLTHSLRLGIFLQHSLTFSRLILFPRLNLNPSLREEQAQTLLQLRPRMIHLEVSEEMSQLVHIPQLKRHYLPLLFIVTRLLLQLRLQYRMIRLLHHSCQQFLHLSLEVAGPSLRRQRLLNHQHLLHKHPTPLLLHHLKVSQAHLLIPLISSSSLNTIIPFLIKHCHLYRCLRRLHRCSFREIDQAVEEVHHSNKKQLVDFHHDLVLSRYFLQA